jgi:cytochrome P450
MIKLRRIDPKDDFTSALIAARDEDDGRLTEQELRDTLVLFCHAAVTTSALIGNGLLALGHFPDQMRELWRDESLVVPAIEEFLRYDPPPGDLMRDVLEPTEIAGVRLEPGEHVFLSIGAACHDPARFTDPDVLDFRRADNASLSFGYGIHHCLGAALARLKAQVTFAQLRKRFAPIEVLDLDPERIIGVVRRPKVLPVRVRPV